MAKSNTFVEQLKDILSDVVAVEYFGLRNTIAAALNRFEAEQASVPPAPAEAVPVTRHVRRRPAVVARAEPLSDPIAPGSPVGAASSFSTNGEVIGSDAELPTEE